MTEPSCIALIPARAGSKRVPGKNVRRLQGHPLIAYAIASAMRSGVFHEVVVSSDSTEILDIASMYGARTLMRPPELASDTSPDIEWVTHALEALPDHDCFSILRPTSPFRTAETIARAWRQWSDNDGFDSLRAVELCAQHPGKMWTLDGVRLMPLLEQPRPVPWHSRQYADLPPVYVQNASLEIAWTRTVEALGSIAGDRVMCFLTRDHEGRDINSEIDWQVVESLLDSGQAELPPIERVVSAGS